MYGSKQIDVVLNLCDNGGQVVVSQLLLCFTPTAVLFVLLLGLWLLLGCDNNQLIFTRKNIHISKCLREVKMLVKHLRRSAIQQTEAIY